MSEGLKEEHVGNNSVPPVDVLVPTKPIKEFVEFETSFMNDDVDGSPDYVFQVKNLRSLIQHETELMGKEFPLPGFNFTAQIKCVIKYDNFELSIRFNDPEKGEQPIDLRIGPLKITTIIKNQNGINSDEKLVHEFPFEPKLVYKTFANFCTLSYNKNLKDAYDHFENSVTLHLHVRIVATKDLFLDGGVLLWRVEVSRDQLDSPLESKWSPFFHVHPDGLRMQIKLYICKEGKCCVEVRIVNERRSSTSNVINVFVIHPTDPTRQLDTSFNFCGKGKVILSQSRYSDQKEFTHRQFGFILRAQKYAEKSELLQYVSDGKLLVKVEIE